VNSPYNQTLAATGGSTPYTWSLQAGSLPAGLSLAASTGVISGTPTASGTSNFTGKVTDNASATATKALSIVIAAAPAFMYAESPSQSGTMSSTYVNKLSLTWTPGTTDDWVIIASADISGSYCNLDAKVQMTLDGSQQDEQVVTPESYPMNPQYWLPVFMVKKAALTAASHTVNVDFCELKGNETAYIRNVRIVAFPKAALETYYVETSSADQGVNPAYATYATLNFTPTTAGNYLVIYNAEGYAIGSGALKVRAMNGAAQLCEMYEGTNAGSNGVAYYPFTYVDVISFSASAQTLKIDAAEVNDPQASAIRRCRILAIRTDGGAFAGAVSNSSTGASTTTSTSYVEKMTTAWTPAAGSNWLLLTTALANINTKSAGVDVQMQLNNSTTFNNNVKAMYDYNDNQTYINNNLAQIAGMNVVQNVSGTQQVDVDFKTGSSAYTAKIQDVHFVAIPMGSTQVPLSITTASLPADTVGVAYNQTLAATGGSTPYTWSLLSGSLPTGLSLNASTGAITGTPTASGTSSFTAKVTDNAAATASKALSIAVSAAISITTASLPADTVGVAYNQTLTATGGTGALSWSVSAGSLPAGLSLVAGTGAITGTPTTSGTSNFTVTATDTVSATGTKALSIVINAAISITTSSLPGGTVSAAYSQTLSATGGTGALTWSVNAGSLPAGLSLTSGGAISGTPSASGTSNFTVKATDTVTASATKALSIVISAGLSITTSSLPADTVNVAYNQTLAASGGTTPYTWSLQSGSMPTGLSLNASTGAITGTPTAAGTSSFTAKVTDNVSATATKALSIVINAAISVTTVSLPNGQLTAAYSQTLAATGGTGALSWSIQTGSLPAGLSLTAGTGAITGTPTATGTSSFTVLATDTVSATATKALSIIVTAAPLSITTTSLPGGTVNSAYNQTLSATGGVTPYTWSISSGSLPAGLSLVASTGAITGTPSTSGTANFTARVADNASSTATQALSIVVSAAASFQYAESLSQSSTGSTTYVNKVSLTWTPGAADDWVIIASADVSGSYSNLDAKVQMTLDGAQQDEQVITPEGYPMTPQYWLPIFMLKKVTLTAVSHTVNVDFLEMKGNETAYIRNARIVAFPKAALEMYYVETSATDQGVNPTYATYATLNFTPATVGNYLVIYSAEGGSIGSGAWKVRPMNNTTQLCEMYEGTNGGSYGLTYYPFAYADVINFSASAQTLKIDAAEVNDAQGSVIRRCRILAIRTDGGRFANAVTNSSTGLSTTTSTSYVEKMTTSWTPTAGTSWLLLTTALANINTKSAGVDVQMQLNNTTTFNNNVKAMYDYNDNQTYINNNLVEIAGMNVIQNVSGTQQVDVDFRTGNASYTAAIRDVHFVAIPMN